MAKHELQKPLPTATRKAVGTKHKKDDPAKKNEKKRSDTSKSAESADLRQPKDRDPTQQQVDILKPTLAHIWNTGVLSSDLVQLSIDYGNQQKIGNYLFLQWIEDEDLHKLWDGPFKRFDSYRNDVMGATTLEAKINKLFKDLDGDWEKVLKFLVTCFEFDNVHDNNSEYMWIVRAIAMQTAQIDPSTLFDINLPATTSKLAQASLYFASELPDDPRLRHELPLAGFWLLCATLFDHPWNVAFQDKLETTSSPVLYVIREKLMPTIYKHANKNPGKRSIEKITELDETEANAMVASQDNTITFQTPPTKSTDEYSPPDGWDTFKEFDDIPDDDDDDDDDVVEVVDSHQDDDSRDAVGVVDSNQDDIDANNVDDDDDDIDDCDDEDNDDRDDDGDDAADAAATKNNNKIAKRSVFPNFSSTITEPPTDGMEDDTGHEEIGNGDPGYDDRMATDPTPNHDPSPYPRARTIAEHVGKWRQANMDGVEGDSQIFELALSTQWGGAQAGQDSLATVWLKKVIDTLAEALKNNTNGLRLLPISDKNYKKGKMWIRNEKDLHTKITTHRDLHTYLDMEYGNAAYYASNVKPGDKKLRTRVRVGYNSGVLPDAIRQYLHTGLAQQGRGAGCYESPLQFGEIEKIGALCFYPGEANARALEKELMRHFEWLCPIGLRWDWVNLPYDGRSKWNERSPGLMLWHVYVRRIDAKKVDRELRSWLHPSTPKKDFPYAAVTHYITDWKAAQKGVASVRAYGPVKEQILTMVSKSRDFQELTMVTYHGSDIHGMLKKAVTSQFGSSTCLKLLLSIKASPHQAKKAADEEDKPKDDIEEDATATDATKDEDDDTDDDDNDDEQGDGDGAFTKVKRSRRKKKKKATATPASEGEHDLTPAQLKAVRELERKRQLDRENYRPSPLFLMILPGEMEGTWIFVSRLKYAALARSVLNGLVPFLTEHLVERLPGRHDKILSKWLSKTLIAQTRRRNLVWCNENLCAKAASTTQLGTDEGYEFLEGCEDPLDILEARLTLDPEMAAIKDIDDGATVAGEMDELREAESLLEDAMLEISIHKDALDQTRRQSAIATIAAQKEASSHAAALEVERKKTEALQLQLAAFTQLQATQLAAQQAAQQASASITQPTVTPPRPTDHPAATTDPPPAAPVPTNNAPTELPAASMTPPPRGVRFQSAATETTAPPPAEAPFVVNSSTPTQSTNREQDDESELDEPDAPPNQPPSSTINRYFQPRASPYAKKGGARSSESRGANGPGSTAEPG